MYRIVLKDMNLIKNPSLYLYYYDQLLYANTSDAIYVYNKLNALPYGRVLLKKTVKFNFGVYSNFDFQSIDLNPFIATDLHLMQEPV